MSIFLSIVLLVVGFIFLIKGADYLIDGSVSLSRMVGIPEIVIGLTIVAFGTSVPELVVNIFASIEGHNEVVLGNILGSNIFNLILILGISAIISPVVVSKNTLKREIPFSILITIVFFIFANDMIFADSKNYLSLGEGIVFIVFLLIFMVYIHAISKNSSEINSSESLVSTTNNGEGQNSAENSSIFKIILLIVVGLIGLVIGGKMVVDNAVNIARFFNVSEKLIALTIVSIGTSLPELVTTIIAATKKRSDLAIGNVIGSNILNILIVIGLSIIISPIDYDTTLNTDFYLLIGASLFLFLYLLFSKKRTFGRVGGVIYIITCISYLIFLIIRK